MDSATAARLRAAPLTVARAVPVWVWLVAVVALSVAVRWVLGRRTIAPWIVVDEIIYAELAKSFAAGDGFAIRGEDVGAALGVVYPILISPAYLFDSLVDAYAAAKVINAVAISLVAVPAYFLARRVVSPAASVVAALMSVAVPALLYSGMIMTENAFYPLFVAAALALVLVLERPSPLRVAALVAVGGVAYLTRVQAVVLVPALLTAPLLLALLARRGRRREALRPFRTLYAAVVGAVAAVVVLELVRGGSPRDLLGAYAGVVDLGYEPAEAARWIAYHVAELDLMLGIAPFAALLLLFAGGRALDRNAQALLAATASLAGWLVIQVGTFASLPSVQRVEERNMFYVAPLFFVALLAWIERGAPRPRSAPVLAAVAAALPAVLPFDRLIGTAAVSDTFALLPWWDVHHWGVPLERIALVAVLAAAVVAGLVLHLPQRALWLLPAVVLAFFVVSTFPVSSRIEIASIGAHFQATTRPDRDWIDRVAGRDAEVATIWSGRPDRLVIHVHEFFNRSVGPVFHTGEPTPGNLPEERLTFDSRTGLYRDERGNGVSAAWALADSSLNLAGRPISFDRDRDVAIYRVDGPLRATHLVTGVYDDSWSGETVTYVRYGCDGGTLTAELQSDANLFVDAQRVTARAAGRAVARTAVPPAGTRRLTVPLRPSRSGACVVRFDVERTAVPAETLVDSDDERVLGVRFRRLDYEP